MGTVKIDLDPDTNLILNGVATPVPGTPSGQTITGGQITFPSEGVPGTTNSAAIAGTDANVLVNITAKSNVQWGGQNAPNNTTPISAEWLRTDGTPLGIPGSSMSGQRLQDTGGAFTVNVGNYQIRCKSLTGAGFCGGLFVNNAT